MTTIQNFGSGGVAVASGGNINQQIERVKEKIEETQAQIRQLGLDDTIPQKERKQIQQVLQAQLAMLHERLRQLIEQRSERSDKHAPALASGSEASPVGEALKAVAGSVSVKV
ncbi:FlxA-like family protein [Jeongeupia wiesaeckerbachi]|uniref:FlxA-like family protein n=1 Tax=Jeongeupia wiesaeckerbachi TaxID=3051218 RepID=UPI003D809558